jgi:hypothetical protein
VPDPTATAFYGTRYVMSRLDQRTLGLDTRLNVTFSPSMTLELYAQPFFASGHHSQFKEYVAPRSARLAVYGRDRGTIVATPGADGIISSYTIDADGPVGPSQPFTVVNPDFTEQALRGNVVFRVSTVRGPCSTSLGRRRATATLHLATWISRATARRCSHTPAERLSREGELVVAEVSASDKLSTVPSLLLCLI